MKPLLLTLSGILLAAVGFEFGSSLPSGLGVILGWVGTVVSMFGAVLQFQASKPYVLRFSESEWRRERDGFVIHIPSIRHARGNSTSVVVFMADTSGYQEVVCGVSNTDAGGVVIHSSTPFAGKVVVR